MGTSDWKWWAGRDGENYSIGPLDSREQAIAEGSAKYCGEPFVICEATQTPLRLADWFDVERALENAEENLDESDRVCDVFDDPPYFEIKPEQEKDLQERIAKTIDEWQAAHGLVFTVRTFSAVRVQEDIPGLDEEAGQ